MERCRHTDGAEGPSLSRSFSSASLTDFVHSVRVDSGGRGEASLSSPVYRASGAVRGRVVVKSGTPKEKGLVPSRGGDGTNRDEAEMEEEAVFSSGRSQGMLRRRPLGPVRRSEELTCPPSSR